MLESWRFRFSHYGNRTRLHSARAAERLHKPFFTRLTTSVTFFRFVYNAWVSRLAILLAANLVLLSSFTHAQSLTKGPQSAVTSNDTSYVTCSDKPPGSRTVKSDVLVSSDGKHRAYVEVEARSMRGQSAPGAPSCVNNSRLYVGEGGDYKVVYLQEATDAESGNSLRLVDWSSDGRRLLVELAQWAYEGVGVARSPLIYDTSYGLFRQPELLHVFNKHFGMECSLDVHVSGFSADGKVVIETQPLSPEEEEVLGLQTCSKKKSAWALNLADDTLAPFYDPAKLPHSARTEAQPK
jgi:hypothetical protein